MAIKIYHVALRSFNDTRLVFGCSLGIKKLNSIVSTKEPLKKTIGEDHKKARKKKE